MNLVDKKNIGILVYGRFPTEKAYGSHLIEIAKAFRDKGMLQYFTVRHITQKLFLQHQILITECERINFKEPKNKTLLILHYFYVYHHQYKINLNFGAIYWSFSIKKYLKNQDFLWSTNPNILVPLTKLKSVIIYEKHGAAKYIQN